MKTLLRLFMVFIAIIIISIAFYTSQADELPYIYVKHLSITKGIDAPSAEMVSGAIEKAVVGSKRYRVMSQSQVKEIMKNMELEQALKGCSSESCLRQILQTTSTDFLLYGEIRKDDTMYSVSVNMMQQKEGGSATVVATDTQYIPNLDTKGVMKLAENLVKRLHGEKIAEPTIKDIVSGQDGELVTFTVSSYPTGAQLFINGMKRGVTPVRKVYPDGDYTAVLKYPGFKDRAFPINLPKVKEYSITMEREKHLLAVSVNPEGISVSEAGAKLGEITGKKSTLTMDSGEHILTFQKHGYDAKQVTINLMKDATLAVKLEKSRYKLEVKANVPGAEVLIDGKKKGTAPYKGIHEFGAYKVRVFKEGYLEESKDIELDTNRELEFTLRERKFVPFTVESDPPGAEIYFGGKLRGTTPGSFQWPEGELYITMKNGSYEKKKTITLDGKNKESKVFFDLNIALTVESIPSGADIFINDEKRGNTPDSFKLPEGDIEVKVVYSAFSLKKNLKLVNKRPQKAVFNFNLVPVIINTKPKDSTIYLNDNGKVELGKSPCTVILPVGKHELLISNRDDEITYTGWGTTCAKLLYEKNVQIFVYQSKIPISKFYDITDSFFYSCNIVGSCGCSIVSNNDYSLLHKISGNSWGNVSDFCCQLKGITEGKIPDNKNRYQLFKQFLIKYRWPAHSVDKYFKKFKNGSPSYYDVLNICQEADSQFMELLRKNNDTSLWKLFYQE